MGWLKTLLKKGRKGNCRSLRTGGGGQGGGEGEGGGGLSGPTLGGRSPIEKGGGSIEHFE